MTIHTILEWVVKYAGGVVTILTALALVRPITRKIILRLSSGNSADRLTAIEDTLSQQKEINGKLLHSLFFSACRRAINRGWTTLDEIEDVTSLYETYKALNFNGYGDQLYKKFSDLKTDKELFGSND
ncbi:MAG: hypothetical protein IJH61_04850 [Eubacteriaceae bacterium]|nr:hypothetical protein [Eubacteriaceae bacterium]